MLFDIFVHIRTWHPEHQKFRIVIKRFEDNWFEPRVELLLRNALRNERKS